MQLIRILLMLFCLHTAATNIFAYQHLLKANVRKGRAAPYGSFFNQDSKNFHDSLIYFPVKEYSYTIFAFDLKYNPKLPSSSLPVDALNDFNLQTTASMRLISYNKTSGEYKFKLHIAYPWLSYYSLSDPTMAIKGGETLPYCDTKFLNDKDVTFIIAGKVRNENGKTILISAHSNPYFEIEYSPQSSVELILKKPFPIQVICDPDYKTISNAEAKKATEFYLQKNKHQHHQ